jgi:PAS domain S-box-containing protein
MVGRVDSNDERATLHKDAMPPNQTQFDRLTQPRSLVWWWLAALLAYSLIVPTQLLPPAPGRFVTNIAWTIAATLAAVSSFQAARALTGADRIAWMLLAWANAAWAAGQVAWDIYELVLGIVVPFPSVADIGYFGFGVLMIAGLLVLRSTQQERSLTWLRAANLGLILCGLAVILIVVLTQPFARSAYRLGSALVIVGESTAIAVACIISMYLLWSYSWGARLASVALVTASLVVHTIVMVFYTRELIVDQYGIASTFNLLWLLAFALQHCAARSRLAVTQHGDDGFSHVVQEKHGWVEALLPSALLLCMAVSAIALTEEFTRETLYVASSMLAAFAVVLSLREALLYSRGQQTQAKLEHVTSELAETTRQFEALDARRANLEIETEVTARAGGVGLWQWEIGSKVVQYSREWKHQLGHEEHEISDDFEEWRSRLHPEDHDRMVGVVAQFAANSVGELIEEQRLRHRDGSYRWILTHGTVIRDVDGKAQRMFGSHIDITDRKTIELSLRESEARYRDLVNELESRVAARTSELTEAYRESRNFAYAVAHDLKAPLRAIDGFSHLLDSSASSRLTADEQAYIRRVRQGAIHMASLIDGLLDYSRLEHRELRMGAIECRAFIQEVVQSMDALIHAASASVTLTLEPGWIYADTEGLRIVIRNLLDNALKFRSPARSPRIEIGSYRESTCIVLTLRDNGIGFDPQYGDKIFEIFNRLHASGYEGTGIGLALVRKAVQRMHGRIWAESELDRGATFYVSLPIALRSGSAKKGDRDGSRS